VPPFGKQEISVEIIKEIVFKNYSRGVTSIMMSRFEIPDVPEKSRLSHFFNDESLCFPGISNARLVSAVKFKEERFSSICYPISSKLNDLPSLQLCSLSFFYSIITFYRLVRRIICLLFPDIFRFILYFKEA